MTRLYLVAWLVLTAACSGRALAPVAFDAGIEACQFCRMTGSDGRSAAQLVAPGQDPRFFDDIGCLRDYLKERGPVPADAVAFVADHRTREWVPAASAVYTRHDAVKTPMSSHLLAHASAASREADSAAAGGRAATAAEIFGGALPGGSR